MSWFNKDVSWTTGVPLSQENAPLKALTEGLFLGSLGVLGGWAFNWARGRKGLFVNSRTRLLYANEGYQTMRKGTNPKPPRRMEVRGRALEFNKLTGELIQ